jgi:nickel-type superoxide dismutase maturation protease
MLLIRRVEGESMIPAYKSGVVVLALKLLPKSKKKLRVGDVVIFSHNGIEKLKRVARVSEQGYFMEGDNEMASTDSRSFGIINPDDVIGRILFPLR